MEKFKDALDILLKLAILFCVILTLASSFNTNKDVSDVAKDLAAYKSLVSQPVNSEDCEGGYCQPVE